MGSSNIKALHGIKSLPTRQNSSYFGSKIHIKLLTIQPLDGYSGLADKLNPLSSGNISTIQTLVGYIGSTVKRNPLS